MTMIFAVAGCGNTEKPVNEDFTKVTQAQKDEEGTSKKDTTDEKEKVSEENKEQVPVEEEKEVLEEGYRIIDLTKQWEELKMDEASANIVSKLFPDGFTIKVRDMEGVMLQGVINIQNPIDYGRNERKIYENTRYTVYDSSNSNYFYIVDNTARYQIMIMCVQPKQLTDEEKAEAKQKLTESVINNVIWAETGWDDTIAPTQEELNLVYSPESDFTYTIENGEVTIKKYIGNDEKVVIPNTIEGYPVVKYDVVIFRDTNVKSVVVPYGMKSLHMRCFALSDKLEEVVISNSVTKIGDGVVADCKNLKRVVISDAVYILGDGFCSGCPSLESVTLPKRLTSIGKEAFKDCKSLSDIEIPESVEYIGSEAFASCKSITGIELPSSVEEVGGRAFYACENLESITLAPELAVGASVFEKTAWYEKQLNETGFVISNGKLISAADNMNHVIVPEGVTHIMDSAFYKHYSLDSIALPSSLKYIGSSAFAECVYLKTVEIPENVTVIGASAFYDCRSLTEVKLPEGLISIGTQAFLSCKKLEKVNIPAGLQHLGEDAFYDTAVGDIVLQ